MAKLINTSYDKNEIYIKEKYFMNSKVILERAACEVAKQSSVPPLIFRLPVEKGRQILEDAQNAPVYKCPASIQVDSIDTLKHGCGGNMAIAMAFMSKFRKGIKIHKQLLYYPVTNDNFNTNSYLEFANGYYLYRDGMKWFWNQYEPNLRKRNSIWITPLKASLEELRNMPDTMILNGEADVLRDEGEAYANRLREACNDVTAVRFQGMIHDFVMLNSLDQTNACRAAMDVSTCWINRKNQC